MKHSAKAAARLARERDKLDRRAAGRTGPARLTGRRAGAGQPTASTASAGQGNAGPGVRRASAGRASAGRRGAARGSPGRAAVGTADHARHQHLAQLPYAVVLAGMALGLLLMQVARDAVRGGTLVIAGALLAGSLTRLVLPDGRAGLLRSRRRLVDVALLTALGGGLLIAGLIVRVPG